MKKIMFNDRYGLTQAVLEGRKTMTRREITQRFETVSHIRANYEDYWNGEFDGETFALEPKYRVGEVVAVAQQYSQVINHILEEQGYMIDIGILDYKKLAGWNNKMFVRADLMPHQIRITDIKVERLQDISHEDCLKEGVFMLEDPFYPDRKGDFVYVGATGHYKTPKVAFAYLIDKISGKGTWDSNPYVFAYNFELVKTKR